MIAHRVQTHHPNSDPPVGFYRTVALSFLAVAIILLGLVVFITSKKATITIVAKNDIKNISVTIKIGDSKGIGGTVTTTQFAWTEKYYPVGVKTVDTVAVGTVTLYNKTNQSQTLVKTTRLLSPGNILFRLNDRVIIPAGDQTVANVYADQPGKTGEIDPTSFVIPGLAVEKQKYIYAVSDNKMTGGVRQVGVLSDSDLKLAQDSFKEKLQEAFLTENSTKFSGQAILVSADNVTAVSNKKVGDEVSEFSLSGSSTLTVVLYSEKDLNDLLERESIINIDATGEKIIKSSGGPRVTLVDADVVLGTAQLAVSQSLTVTLDVNADKLAPENFFGKKKDAIERYVLGLDHVSGVEVKFSPIWMLSAPTVPDKIKVIVKNVQ